MKKILLAGILLSVLLAAPGLARGRAGAGYMGGGTTRWDAMGKQSYIAHGPLVYARWSVDLSYYLDLDFGAEWRHQGFRILSKGDILH